MCCAAAQVSQTLYLYFGWRRRHGLHHLRYIASSSKHNTNNVEKALTCTCTSAWKRQHSWLICFALQRKSQYDKRTLCARSVVVTACMIRTLCMAKNIQYISLLICAAARLMQQDARCSTCAVAACRRCAPNNSMDNNGYSHFSASAQIPTKTCFMVSLRYINRNTRMLRGIRTLTLQRKSK